MKCFVSSRAIIMALGFLGKKAKVESDAAKLIGDRGVAAAGNFLDFNSPKSPFLGL